ncbi:lipocalin-like protein [Paraburkholderia sp. BL18I3N2]|nr:lipocalin-like protein [Paraburkholderia sp. BL18I3N2]
MVPPSRVLENAMTPLHQTLRAAALVALAICLAVPKSFAQTAPGVVGSWSLVSLTVSRSGSDVDVLGPHPSGQLIFGSDGRYVLLGVRADLPKFASGNRLSGTSEENERIVQGNFAHFGTYTVDPAAQVIVFRIQKSTFPNWDGDVQQRPFTLDGDRLTYVTPGSFGYGASKVVWQRMK